MIDRSEMKKDRHGYIWDPGAWLANRKEQQAAENEEASLATETEYQRAKAAWHLKQNMIKRFGNRPWMHGVVDPDTLEWDEQR